MLSGMAQALDRLSALDDVLAESERLVVESVSRFVRERYLPRAASLFEKEEFPRDLIPELAELGLLGASLSGYGCAGMSAVEYGLSLRELEYGDSALRSFVSVQGSLAMFAIHAFGTDAQKARLLPELARGKLIGCFGLTEPDSGSDPGSMQTRARSDGDGFVLSGTKMWITNAPFADVAVVWAKVDEGGAESIRGFLIEREHAGFSTPRIQHKMSLRASETGEIVLSEARFGIAWGALGAARACFETALAYTSERIQFGAPLTTRQLVQARLADMASAIATAELTTLHFARLKAARGKLLPEQVSLCKRQSVKVALDVARDARSLLGANGILLDYPVIRHMLNLESVLTYEGTHEIHTLAIGRALTGESAF
jgi:glutaryl-CoA dehydrogenase